MTAVVLALGSNLGARLENLRAAVAMLQEGGVQVTARSSIWETAPVPADQPPFLNAALAGETALAPLELLRLAKSVEWRLGRRPGRRWGPRPIDIDLIFSGEQSLDSAELTLPHPRIAERAFVLAPLAEVWPGPLPVLGSRAVEVLAAVGMDGVVRTGAAL
ncbi:MAG: 2-amino-4-hydroxy-6-hydroxymethyldihydropteridine diphosphokinase [Dehalococcoidia bacterium]